MRLCVAEAEGYLFSEHYKPGIVYYTLVPPQDTTVDKIAFGFMTDEPNGTIIRVDSGIDDYIEAKLVSFRPMSVFFPRVSTLFSLFFVFILFYFALFAFLINFDPQLFARSDLLYFSVKLLAQRNDTERKQLQNSFETVLFQFHRCADSLMALPFQIF